MRKSFFLFGSAIVFLFCVIPLGIVSAAECSYFSDSQPRPQREEKETVDACVDYCQKISKEEIGWAVDACEEMDASQRQYPDCKQIDRNSLHAGCSFNNIAISQLVWPEGEDVLFEAPKLEDELTRLRGEANTINQIQGVTAAELIGRGIKAAMGIMGSVALIVFIYGGLMWMTARGNSEKASKALHTLLWGGLGVAVMLSSYAVVSFVFEAFK